MRAKPSAPWVFITLFTAMLLARASAGQLPLEPVKERGRNVTPAYEGWFPNADGSFSLLLGYFNRNRAEIVTVPVGADNHIEPGGPDQGQPTYFLPQRQWGVFTITVPRDFGTNKLTWTLVVNGEKAEIPISLHPSYEVRPYKDAAMGNTPPVFKFDANGTGFTGPPRGIAASLTGTAGKPVVISFLATDDLHEEVGPSPTRRPPIGVVLTKFRGPGTVTFDAVSPPVGKDGRVTASSTFSEPGEYTIRVQGNDSSGDGGAGFQCCWTNVHLRVTVR